MNNNTAGNEITAPVILTDEQTYAQRYQSGLEKRQKSADLFSATMRCKGHAEAMTIARDLVRKIDPTSLALSELCIQVFDAHEAWSAANDAWSESL